MRLLTVVLLVLLTSLTACRSEGGAEKFDQRVRDWMAVARHPRFADTP